MRWAMILFAFLCIALGVWPEPLYRMLPYPVQYVPYTAAHVVTQLQLLLFSGLAFFLMLPYLKRTLTITLDVDWVYRSFLPGIVRRFTRRHDALRTAIASGLARASTGATVSAKRLVQRRGPKAILAGASPTRSMALWVLVLLLAYLLLYYV
jgi:multicomponent Na+:H+ antiporter subunit D